MFNLLSKNIRAFKTILKDKPFALELLSYSIPSYSVHSILNCKYGYSLEQRNRILNALYWKGCKAIRHQRLGRNLNPFMAFVGS